MFDTPITIIGNVLNMPEWRRTTKTGSLVTSFKVASTARRLNRETGQWVDGNSLRVRVNCWRRLAEGVAASVRVGDPVVVVGRLYTRDWVDEQQNKRISFELEAVAVGHDLSKGRGRFARTKATLGTAMVEDAEAEARAGTEATEPVPADEIPVELDTADFDADFPETSGYDPIAELRAAGLDPTPLDTGGYGVSAGGTAHGHASSEDEDGDGSGNGDGSEDGDGTGHGDGSDDGDSGGGSRRRRGRRVAVPA
ncbi:MAG TPA: single-stranded DNA-binding protein [Micromonosporaceae bacterium]|jgi:single-strand DNA-binding protein|nr:single-stranded DNA-binding protein [Micromonosporaceae bacterium]